MTYSLLDRPSLLRALFYPRRDNSPPPGGAADHLINVDDNVMVCCRFYYNDSHQKNPWLLYFHGNGEVASDYDEIVPIYRNKGLNLIVAEFRGYGKSTGQPAFSTLIKDTQLVWQGVEAELKKKEKEPNIYVMGRSMGSIPALEIAWQKPQMLKGLIIESGFISPVGLIRRLKLSGEEAGLSRVEEECRRKVNNITLPALVIHGEEDNLVPLGEGENLYRELGSPDKKLVTIPFAGHNDIMMAGGDRYFKEIADFVVTAT